MLGAREDVIVVGAGAIGLAAALALCAQGRQVRVIERGRIGAATSHGNCGTLTPSMASAEAMRSIQPPRKTPARKPRMEPKVKPITVAATARMIELTEAPRISERTGRPVAIEVPRSP